MTKIVILGSCRFAPYEILAVPNKIPNAWNTEEGYKKASEKFYPAITQADVVLVYAPDGIGEHTARDILEAHRQGKEIFLIIPFKADTRVKGDAAELAQSALLRLEKEEPAKENGLRNINQKNLNAPRIQNRTQKQRGILQAIPDQQMKAAMAEDSQTVKQNGKN